MARTEPTIRRISRPIRALVGAATLTALVLGARVSQAEDSAKSDDAVKSRILFGDARKLVDAGDYEHACPKFEESLRLKVGIGTQFNLADCWEHIGRTASARALFLGAAASAHALGQAEREQVARARAEGLEPRLVRLVLDVRATDPGLVIRRDHVNVERDSWGTAAAIDPGAYLIEASAPGKKRWSARITVPGTATEPVSVTIPPLDAEGAAACDSPPTPETAKKPEKRLNPRPNAEKPPPGSEPSSGSARRTAYALSLAGLGIAAVGVGTVLAVEYKSKNDDAKAICPTSLGCSRSEINHHSQLVSDAKAFRTWSFVGFGVGAAALITSGVFFLSPGSSSQRAGFVAAPFVAADGSWGATALGRF